ncbi:MAG: phage tail tape measure protein [Ruminococcaceae bacterium]|nr:phage tail tape measure protein [Oscillospiraceae bacterium]
MATINLAEYQYTLSLDDSQYTKSMAEAEKTADSMKSKVSGIGDYLSTALTAGLAAAGIAVAAAIKSGVDAAADLQEQMSQFQASTGATAEEVEKINDLAKSLYATNTDSMEDIVATSTAMMTQMQLTTDQVEALQQSIMDFAKTTGQSNTDVVAGVDKIGDAWGMTAEDTVAYLDVIKESSEQFGTDVAAVTDALASCAPAASALGLSIDEVNGMMNLFASSGLDAGQAMTALSYAAKKVESPEAFKEMLSDIEAITDPTERAQAAVELFGSKAGVALANVFDGTAALDEYILTLDECTGAVSDASAAFDSNFNVQLELLKKQFQGVTLEVGEKLLPVLNTVLGWVSDNMPAIVSTVSGVVDQIIAFVQPLIDVVQSLFQSFTDGEGTASEAFNSLQGTISSVLEAVSAVIQAFVDLISAVWDKWGEDIISVVSTAFNSAMTVIQDVLTLITDIVDVFIKALNGDWEGAFESLKKVAEDGWKVIQDVFRGVVEPILGFLKSILDGIAKWAGEMVAKAKEAASNFVNTTIQGIKDMPEKIYNTIRAALSKVTSWGTEMKNTAVKAMQTLVQGIVETLSDLPSQMVSIGGNLVKGIWNGINDQVGWVLNKIRGFGDQVVDGIKRIFGIASPSKLMRDEIGKNLADGIGVGFEEEIDKVNRQIKDSINTEFEVQSDVVSKIRNNPAYEAAGVTTTQAGATTISSPFTLSYGDIVIEGNADDSTVQDFRKALEDHAHDIYNLVFSKDGLEVFNQNYAPTRKQQNNVLQGIHFKK